MKKRIFGFVLALVMLGGSICAMAAELTPRASLYLDGYGISISPDGNSKMSVTYIVYGTKTMDCLGAQKILVEEWNGQDWEKTGTYSAEKNPDFYAYEASEHIGTVTFYGLPGIQYRATLTAYAELNGGSDTGTVTCTPKTCK
jgi:hypothetical protein